MHRYFWILLLALCLPFLADAGRQNVLLVSGSTQDILKPVSAKNEFPYVSWGPFSTTSYFQSPTIEDGIPTNAFTVCVAGIYVRSPEAHETWVSNWGNSPSGGFYLAGAHPAGTYYGPVPLAASSSTCVLGEPCAICYGRNGNLLKIKSHRTAINVNDTATTAYPALLPTRIGLRAHTDNPSLSNPFIQGRMYSVYATTTPVTDALLNSLTAEGAATRGFTPDANTRLYCQWHDFDGATMKCRTGKMDLVGSIPVVRPLRAFRFAYMGYFKTKSANDVFKTVTSGADWHICLAYRITSAGGDTMLANSDATNGFKVRYASGATSVALYSVGTFSFTEAISADQRVVCFGKDGANFRAFSRTEEKAPLTGTFVPNATNGTGMGANFNGYGGFPEGLLGLAVFNTPANEANLRARIADGADGVFDRTDGVLVCNGRDYDGTTLNCEVGGNVFNKNGTITLTDE